jgi:membrane-associated HD superfamily phosphohydrolase
MNPLIIVAVLLALISVVGLVKKNREIFLTGYFVYGLLVFGAETNEFISNENTISLFVGFLWLIQAVLALPVRAKYDSETVKKDRIKICVCFSLINLTGVLVPGISPAPEVTFYIHLVMSVLPLAVIYLLSSGKIVMEK